MTHVGTEAQQPTSLDTTSHQNQMEAVFGESYPFTSNDQERDQATTQAELVAAAVAAAANSTNGTSNYHTLVASADSSNDNVIATATAQKMEDVTHTTELVKRELANQKVRAENRERKKRWREQNEDRNKDNDLRCRVNKRANRLFGKAESANKNQWIQAEFAKRQRKRQEKERRKTAVNGAIGAGTSASSVNSSNDYQSPNSMASFTPAQLEALQQQGSELFAMVSNNLPPLSPTTAAKLLQSNLAVVLSKADKNDPNATAAAAAAVLQSPHFLQLNQLLSQQSAEAAQYTSDIPTSNADTKPETMDYKLSLDQIDNSSNAEGSSDGKGGSSINDQEGKSSAEQTETGKSANGQGGDYPMDAVMTLMQLNAGWRQ
ncbi:hypothetical protein K450DRAFT_246851 [Umbelopsis ramanniana AG]|uniref:DUF3020 domain-containing protein n=1 Tax=Umbelopsis ramanniana AG TaxID=1314678 RepID=A0AAD5HDC7_UMBRA|nr:uncharacterized protein K450DRAFT_246851 [Umbelopsis ramanniana AG]KAI8578446.1 hypothetical protein K450DRAFT_246851 [Umbelopsis ramanniana AG]